MTSLHITTFRGANRKLKPRLIPDANATSAVNVRMTSGDLSPWRVPATVASAPGGTLGMYRMGRDTPTDSNYWLTFTAYVDVIRGLVAADTTERTIYTGGGATTPRWTDNTMALSSAPYPTAWRILGVPGPATAPVIALHTDGPTTTKQDLYVVVTFVNDKGEEGTISPVSNMLSVYPGATIDVSSLPSVPSGAYGIAHYRIYATNIGNSSASFAFAMDAALGSGTVTINTAALGATLETIDYDMPPADGHSLTMCWNEFAAMATGKSVRFCAPALIYAWPSQYEMLMGDTVVGMGTFDQTLLVLTTGQPALITGQDPSAMQSQRVPLNESCVSKPSIVSFGHATVWASPNGLMSMSNAGPVNLTGGIMKREDWQALVPSTIVGEQYLSYYLGSYNDGSGVKGFIIDLDHPDGIVFLSAGYTAEHFDSLLGGTYVLSGTSIQKWDAGDTAMSATWTSKVFRQIDPTSFSWARLVADSYGQTVRFYRDSSSTPFFTKTVANGAPFRLPIGFSTSDWQVSIDTTVGVQALLLGDNVNEISG
jgi:hypothetical protein